MFTVHEPLSRGAAETIEVPIGALRLCGSAARQTVEDVPREPVPQAPKSPKPNAQSLFNR